MRLRLIGALALATLGWTCGAGLAQSAPAAVPNAAANAAATLQNLAALGESRNALDRAHAAVVLGDREGLAGQAHALTDMAHLIAGLDLHRPLDDSQIHSVVSYLLSGGPPEPVIDLVSNKRLSESQSKLVRGVLAYVLGRRGAAATLLADVDPLKVDLAIAGELAFAKSVVEDPSDRQKTMASLDEARLLAPGGLVEEAALRREIGLVAEARDAPRFYSLSRQYLERFQTSIYAPEFMRKIAVALVSFDLVPDRVSLERLTPVLRWYPPQQAARIVLEIARMAALNGRLDLADTASARVLSASVADDGMKRRAHLYQGAAKIMGSAYDDGVSELTGLDPASLSPSDRDLLAAALETARNVRVYPSISGAQMASATGGSATIDAAGGALAAAQSVLTEK